MADAPKDGPSADLNEVSPDTLVGMRAIDVKGDAKADPKAGDAAPASFVTSDPFPAAPSPPSTTTDLLSEPAIPISPDSSSIEIALVVPVLEIDFDEESVVLDLATTRESLARTDDAWAAAAATQVRDAAPGSAPSRPQIAMPAPFELGGRSPSPPRVAGTPSAPPVANRAVPASQKPPPLPNRASQKPPPLPARVSAMPPVAVRGPSSPPQPEGARASVPPPLPQAAVPEETQELAAILAGRVQRLELDDDKTALARAHVELSLLSESWGDDSRTTTHAEAALRANPEDAAAHAILRRRKHGRGAAAAMLAHVERESAQAENEMVRVELACERARLLDAKGESPSVVKEAWERALTLAPSHPAALFGRLGALTQLAEGEDSEAVSELADHLGTMSHAFYEDAPLAARLDVERAHLFVWKLGRQSAGDAALARAVERDGRSPLVRRARILHLAATNDTSSLAQALDDESLLENDATRTAELAFDAACLYSEVLGEPARAIVLLERARMCAPTRRALDRMTLDRLVTLYEHRGELEKVHEARRARVPLLDDTQTVVYELRKLATISERSGNLRLAAELLAEAAEADLGNANLLEDLDRVLAMDKRHDERERLWLAEATRVVEDRARAKALCRAAAVAERQLERPEDAKRHLRSAWVTLKSDPEVVDGLARLSSPTPAGRTDREVRALVDLYAEAAEASKDRGRRHAYLEKAALILEELLGDLPRSKQLYDAILAEDPERRSAVLGLGRVAGRAGDERALARALLYEVRFADGRKEALNLRFRAAKTLEECEPDRALVLVEAVLGEDPENDAARELETRLHGRAGRWTRAAQSLEARVRNEQDVRKKVSLLLDLASIESTHTGEPRAAVVRLREAHKLDPAHAVPQAEIAKILEGLGDHEGLSRAREEMAKEALGKGTRALLYALAGEVEELRLRDDENAARLYGRALQEAPEDEWIAARLDRVLVRRLYASVSRETPSTRLSSAHLGERLAFLTARSAHARNADEATVLRLEQAELGLLFRRETQEVIQHATGPSRAADDLFALRLLHRAAVRSKNTELIVKALERQAELVNESPVRVGTLSELSHTKEWKLAGKSGVDELSKILDIDGTDLYALNGILRDRLLAVRRGENDARRRAISCLTVLAGLAADDGTKLAHELRLGMLLELEHRESGSTADLENALERYRRAVLLDGRSVAATTCLARLSNRLGDAAGALLAATELAALATTESAKARYLLDAAELLLGDADDPRLGARADRRLRAMRLLEDTLDAQPDLLAAALHYARISSRPEETERLVATFRTVLARARDAATVVFLGTEIAKRAKEDQKDLPVATAALQQVRLRVPDHVPSLLGLAELCVAQRAWSEAVEVLEEVVQRAQDRAPKLTALFALANVHERVLANAPDAEQALRRAIDVDETNATALRGLVRILRGKLEIAPEKRGPQYEIAALLERIVEVDPHPDARAPALLELATARTELGDAEGAERALVEAVATCPEAGEPFDALRRFHLHDAQLDAVSYARALAQVVARAKELGHESARFHAALGHVEVETLGRLRDGLPNLERAVALGPDLHETRALLASTQARLGSHAGAIATVTGMIVPDAMPLFSLARPEAVLELYERSLQAERRPEEAIVASELRAIAGTLDAGRYDWLRARRLGAFESRHAPLDRTVLSSHVVPEAARTILLDIAFTVAGLENSVLKANLAELGISSKDRLPKRSDHPIRGALDRLAKAAGISSVEVVVTDRVKRTRVIFHDDPWILVPRAVADLPESTQLASVARALARIALAVPWLEELSPPHVGAYLVACAHVVSPRWGKDAVALAQWPVAQYSAIITKEISRKQKQSLEKLEAALGHASDDVVSMLERTIGGLAQAELRASFLLTGDLLGTLDELRRLDGDLAERTSRATVGALEAVLAHPFAGDVARFALTTEAAALRRRLGSSWAS